MRWESEICSGEDFITNITSDQYIPTNKLQMFFKLVLSLKKSLAIKASSGFLAINRDMLVQLLNTKLKILRVFILWI
jgi:hypothetical protein